MLPPKQTHNIRFQLKHTRLFLRRGGFVFLVLQKSVMSRQNDIKTHLVFILLLIFILLVFLLIPILFLLILILFFLLLLFLFFLLLLLLLVLFLNPLLLLL
jgi:hypothetical protein